MTQLNASTRLLADWWENLGPEGQKKYIKDHPNSDKAKKANEAPKDLRTPHNPEGVDFDALYEYD